ncbi:MAG TPA: sialidase family protein [Planctomycetaceae bacterium]
MTAFRTWLIIAALVAAVYPLSVRAEEPADVRSSDGILRIDLLPPGPGNPRNSEGDFIRLADGRVLFVYTHFTGGAADDAAAHLAARSSSDGGRTWADENTIVVPNDGGRNVMSVSLVRLDDGRIALFYLRKDSAAACHPLMRTSSDEGKTWGDPSAIVADADAGYYVLNNDRVVQLADGRLVAPLAQHVGPGMPKWAAAARLLCYVSDDAGRTWKRGSAAPVARREGRPVVTQEPGVVELSDGRLMMYCRTDAGSQFAAFSSDRGETWTEPSATELRSPLSPATIERLPGTDSLLAVWNDHRDAAPELRGLRTPLRLALSDDDGRSWKDIATLEEDRHGWYCYTAVEFVGENVLFAYCAGDRRENNGLAATRITLFPLDRLRP